MGKKNKGRKRASERNASTKPGPSTPSPRLSADAAEWHPPSFMGKTVENESEKDQQPALVGELKGEAPSATDTVAEGIKQEHCPGSNTPPGDDEGREDGSTPTPLPSSAPAITCNEPTAAVSTPADGSSSVPGDDEGREDGSTPAPLPSSAPAIASDEPTAAVSTRADGSSSVPGGEQEREDGSTPAPLPSSAPAIASDEPTAAVSTPADGSSSVPGDDEGREDGSTPAPLPKSAPAITSDEPTAAVSTRADGSSSVPGGEQEREDGSTPAPLPSSAPAIASDEPTAAVSTRADGSSSVPGDDEGREDGSTPAPLPKSAPAIASDEPTAAVSTPADGSSSVPGDEQEREDASTPAPPDSAQGDSTTASDEPPPVEVLTTEDVKSGSVEVVGDDEAQPDGVESDEATPVPALDDAPSAPNTSEDEGPRNVVPDAALVLEDGAGVAPGEVMATANCTAADPSNACGERAGEPAVAGLPETATAVATADCQGTPTDGCTVAEATAADTDAVNGSKPEVASGATGQHDKVPGGDEGREGTRGGKQLTDAASSDSAETSRSDPDLSYGGGKNNGLGGKFSLGDDGGYGGGLLDDPRWRWGSVVAVAAVVLLIGLRRR